MSASAITSTDVTELPIRDRLCLTAIDHFGQFGFDQSMLEMSLATDVDVETLTELFGDVAGLRAACDEYLVSTVRAAKTAALTSRDPHMWSEQIGAVESFAPMMAYLVRSLQSADDHGRALMERMTDNMERYLEDAVAAGTVKPSRDPKGRVRFLAMCSAGGFLLYQSMHATPNDLAAVLRDYARDMVVPALELYSYGLMTDDVMFQAISKPSTSG